MREAPEPLRSGPWTVRRSLPRSPGRDGVFDLQVWHDDLALPVLDFTGGAWVPTAPSFGDEGRSLRFLLIALASHTGFEVVVDLARGHWRSAGEPHGRSVAVLQERFGARSAGIAPWPVLVPPSVPAPDVAPPTGSPGECSTGSSTGSPTGSRTGPSNGSPPSLGVTTERPRDLVGDWARPEGEDEPARSAATPRTRTATTADGRWVFVGTMDAAFERASDGRLWPNYSFVMRDRAAAHTVLDSRATGTLCRWDDRRLHLRRGVGAPVRIVVDLDESTFWSENGGEPRSGARDLAELPQALAHR